MFYSKKLSQFTNLNHCFFSRKNGFSRGTYNTLNCGFGSNDSKINITKNLNYVSDNMGVKLKNLILMNQTHSNRVISVDKHNVLNKKFDSDSLVTKLKGISLGVLTADCVPIILYDETINMIGCIHAGWKGAFAGIIENTLFKFKEISDLNKITASVGPCIGKESYEVNEDFYRKFIEETKLNQVFFEGKNDKKYLFDIRGYVINKLKLNGVSDIDDVNRNTFKEADNFFSYRRSQKLGELDYGRCISTICLKT
tara:strand:+ start:1330 stop:2091 length:762 start_codon:yes stop_codon:yes gene_type:complete